MQLCCLPHLKTQNPLARLTGTFTLQRLPVASSRHRSPAKQPPLVPEMKESLITPSPQSSFISNLWNWRKSWSLIITCPRALGEAEEVGEGDGSRYRDGEGKGGGG